MGYSCRSPGACSWARGLLSAWPGVGGLGQEPWHAHAASLIKLAGAQRAGGQGGESSHNHTKAGYSASGLNLAAPLEGLQPCQTPRLSWSDGVF